MKRIVRRRWFRMRAAKRAAPLGHPSNKRQATKACAETAPSLRVADKKRACFVARLTRCPGIELRLASRIHRFLASNANPFHCVRGSSQSEPAPLRQDRRTSGYFPACRRHPWFFFLCRSAPGSAVRQPQMPLANHAVRHRRRAHLQDWH